jgi:hypothetical protein
LTRPFATTSAFAADVDVIVHVPSPVLPTDSMKTTLPVGLPDRQLDPAETDGK